MSTDGTQAGSRALPTFGCHKLAHAIDRVLLMVNLAVSACIRPELPVRSFAGSQATQSTGLVPESFTRVPSSVSATARLFLTMENSGAAASAYS